jgi:pSer/pThr/pTyr-binding forkhead associated (FHA) protein
MARVKVTLHGQILTELQLQPGQEYIAGRGSQSQIVLSNEGGISRQHIKIFFSEDSWQVQLLSKYGGLIHSGQEVDKIILTNELRFSVPPYEFQFLSSDISQQLEPDELVIESLNEPAQEISAKANVIVPSQKIPLPESDDDALPLQNDEPPKSAEPVYVADPNGSLESTSEGIVLLNPYLRIINNKLKTEEILKLEGNLWTIGRHPNSEVFINDPVISRKHFDISRMPEGYFISDHGSSNGTKVNGEELEANSSRKLVSGDVITIRHLEIIFEVHDMDFQNKIQNLPELSASITNYDALSERSITNASIGSLSLPAVYQSHLPATSASPQNTEMPKVESTLHKLKLKAKSMTPIQKVIGVMVVVLCLSFIFKQFGTSSSSSTSPDHNANTNSNGELSSDKKKEAADIFNLAKEYYINRKYSLCISQIEKLHVIVPFLNNSKEIESFCHQGLELEQIEDDRRRREEAKAEVENKIKKTVDECKLKITEATTLDQLNMCLQQAIELDPQNVQIAELQTQIKIRDEQKKDNLQKQADARNRLKAGETLFNSANKSYSSGKLKIALDQYLKFVHGGYGPLAQQNNVAQRNIASIRNVLDSNLKNQISTCQSALDKGDFKIAVTNCSLVLKENPENEVAKNAQSKAISLLKREMKSLYEDAILEESLGNLESAKEKWSKIIEGSVPEIEYYSKAKQKLKIYGIGM